MKTKTATRLHIDLLEFNLYIRDAVQRYRQTVRTPPIEENAFTDFMQYAQKQQAGLLSGQLADIVILDAGTMGKGILQTGNERFFCLDNFNGHNGALLELYDSIMQKSGIYRGRRFFLPTAACFPVFFTTKEKAGQYEIATVGNSFGTWKDVQKTVRLFLDKSNARSKYFFDPGFNFMCMVKYCGINFIDLENKKAIFDTEEFIQLLDIYKDIYPAICPPPVFAKYKSHVALLENDIVVMLCDYALSNMERLSSVYSMVICDMDSEIEIFPVPLLCDGLMRNSSPVSLVGINGGCEDKESALSFITILLSHECQRHNMNFLQGMPVNRSTSDWSGKFYTSCQDDVKIFGQTRDSFKRTPLPAKLVLQMESFIQKLDNCVVFPSEVSAIIQKSINEFLSGRISSKEMSMLVQKNVTDYLGRDEMES